MNVCQLKYLIYMVFQTMKFYVCEYKTQGNFVTFPVTENITSQNWRIDCPKDFDDTVLINTFFSYNLEHFLVFWPGSHSVHIVNHVLWEGVMHSSEEFTQNYVRNISSS